MLVASKVEMKFIDSNNPTNIYDAKIFNDLLLR